MLVIGLGWLHCRNVSIDTMLVIGLGWLGEKLAVCVHKFRRCCGLIVLSFSPAASFYFSSHLGELICLYLYNFLVFSGFFGLPRFIFLGCWVIFSGCLAIISCFLLGFFPLPLYFCMYLGDFVSLWTNFLVVFSVGVGRHFFFGCNNKLWLFFIRFILFIIIIQY